MTAEMMGAASEGVFTGHCYHGTDAQDKPSVQPSANFLAPHPRSGNRR
jgi:hypothetical protein